MKTPKFKVGIWIKRKDGNMKFRIIAVNMDDEKYTLNDYSSIDFDYAEEDYIPTVKDTKTYPLREVRNPYNRGLKYASISDVRENQSECLRNEAKACYRRLVVESGCTLDEAKKELKDMLLETLKNIDTLF